MANFTSILTGKQVESLLANYATCATAGGTAAKVATISSINGAAPQFELFTGVTVRVKFTNSNTVANPTLNVNSTGAKAIKKYGTTAPGTAAKTSWSAGAIVSLTYDGSYWVMNDIKDDQYNGDITNVIAGKGLTDGGASGEVTLNVGAGNGISVADNAVSAKAGSGITVDANGINANTSFTTSGKNYKVQVDSTSGGLFVNVPWQNDNTTYTAGKGIKITSNQIIAKDHNHTAAYTPAGSVTLTNGTAPSMNFNTGTNTDTPYISSLTTGDYTPAGSVTLNNGTAPSMGSATTKYLSASASGTAVGANGTGECAPNAHTHSVTVSGTTGANSGTAVKAVTGYASFSGGSLTGTKTFNTDAIKSIGGTKNYGFSASTSNVMTAPTVTNGVLSFTLVSASTQDAHTGTAASTGTVGFTAASLGTATTADVAPSGHTHSYGSSTALTTGANSGTKVTALTGVKVTTQPTITLTANTSSATGRITYVESQGTFTAGTTPKASASFTGTKGTVVTGGTTKYMKFSAGTTPKSSASFTGTAATISSNGASYIEEDN